MPAPPFPPPPATATAAPPAAKPSPATTGTPAPPAVPPPPAVTPLPASAVPAPGTDPLGGRPATAKPAGGSLYGGTPATAAATGDRSAGATPDVGTGQPTPGRAGTVYGGSVTDGPGFATVSFPAGNPVENTGSLTGHILAQGWTDAPAERSSTTKVVIVLAASLGLLVAVSLVIVAMANDALGGLLENLISG
ncbi:hypothetical protein [Micromonospora cathayae]|uniref:Uncharacterized protein n=1 Tax=Micromonospora cathayae TaxID=3028804 RepID=A0ABY7ZTE0_9ACTN|nr:hypothetical protein [Micromonospora sp. HUAS 3]WDZ86300.1 hypothetical protein PVK37_07815 [Micromonospora sp. HUAS 3]